MTGKGAAPRKIYRSSPLRVWLLLIVSLGFVVAAILVALQGGLGAAVGGTLGACFFGLNAIIFGTLILRPQTVVLDRDGFELGGGLMRAPHRTCWREARGFRVGRAGRWGGPKVVALRLRQ